MDKDNYKEKLEKIRTSLLNSFDYCIQWNKRINDDLKNGRISDAEWEKELDEINRLQEKIQTGIDQYKDYLDSVIKKYEEQQKS